MSQYVWLDKKLTVLEEKKSPLLDEGFLYGQGLFETMRVYSGKVFLLERHIKRLLDGCKQFDIIPPKAELLKRAVNNTVRRNKLRSAYMRLNVWKARKTTRIFIFTKKNYFYNNKDYLKGWSAKIIKEIKLNETSPLTYHKTLNYYFYKYLTNRVIKKGIDESILLNTKGFVCEGSRSNIFIVHNNKVITPSSRSGCLSGITRGAVIELCRKLKIDIRQKDLKTQDLFKSQEIFLTNSLIGIMPLVKIDNKNIGSGKPGMLSILLLAKYRELAQNYINRNYKF